MRSVRGANVCVVGGAGFLGSHLVNYLIEERSCKVSVIDNFVAGQGEFVHPDATVYPHDITWDEKPLFNFFQDREIQFVFNYAAWPYVPDSYKRPLQVFNVNCFGALKVINTAQEAGCETIIQVSSAEIYGEGLYDEHDYGRGLHENCAARPCSSYGASKLAIDNLLQARWKEARTPVISLRQFNCIGERETHPYVVPEIISQIHQKNTAEYSLTVRLGNNSSRDFLYAGDAVSMAVELLEKGEFGQVYNLGSEQSIRVYDLAQKIGDVIGCGKITVEEDESRKRPWEIWHLQSDNRKIYSTIDARPRIDLDEALRRTIEYYVGNGRRWCWE